MGAKNLLSTKPLWWGIAATVILFVVAVVVPLFGFILGLLTMVPAIYLSRKSENHWVAFQIVLAASLLIMLVFRNLGPALGYLIEYGVPTVSLAVVARKKAGPLSILAQGSAIGALMIVAAIFFYAVLVERSPVEMLQQAFQANLELVSSVYRQMGVADEQLATLTDSAKILAHWVGMLFPALIFASYFMLNGLTMVVVTVVGRYRQTAIDWGKGRPFAEFAVFPQLVWALIGCWMAILLLPDLPEVVNFVIYNCTFILFLFYFIQGLAIIHYYLDFFQVGFGGRFFIFFMLFAFLFLLLAVVVIGLFDLWVDFRRFVPRETED